MLGSEKLTFMTLQNIFIIREVTHKDTHPHQVVHVGFAGGVDVLQELQQIEGVAVHQVDSYGQIWLVLDLIRG